MSTGKSILRTVYQQVIKTLPRRWKGAMAGAEDVAGQEMAGEFQPVQAVGGGGFAAIEQKRRKAE